MRSLWISGSSRSGKTQRLLEMFEQWTGQHRSLPLPKQGRPAITPAVLVLTASTANQRDLSDRLLAEVISHEPIVMKTPIAFMKDEVSLFWPLIFQALKLNAQFPLHLRPETEQELATQLWRSHLEALQRDNSGMMEYRFVRDTLDLLQLAGAGGTPLSQIADLLCAGLPGLRWDEQADISCQRGELLQGWHTWCLERGFLSYGVIYDLYSHYLLGNPSYEVQLLRRYQAVFADDLDDYPALAADILRTFLDHRVYCVATYNIHGQSRLGLNADPQALWQLQEQFEQCERLNRTAGLTAMLTPLLDSLASDSPQLLTLPPEVEVVQLQQTRHDRIEQYLPVSRASLLRATADRIIRAVQEDGVRAADIAVIAPGLDAIARYTLIDILSKNQIAVEPLNEQRPLITSPLVRALLTLLTLVYPNLGHLTERDRIAEMLVVLSPPLPNRSPAATIDPVRAGLLSDHCYHFAPDHPHLLPIMDYDRWDRFGHQVVAAYEQIYTWIERQRSHLAQHPPHYAEKPAQVLNRAIQDFFGATRPQLTYGELSVLRELMETAQHFWDVERRLEQSGSPKRTASETLEQFIKLLRRGTITANAYPSRQGKPDNAVLLATIYQYRTLRRSHPWQFWLDVGSVLWQEGGATGLFAHHLFWRDRLGQPWTAEAQEQDKRDRLNRVLRDLIARVDQRLILCHSELAVNGAEQLGPLSPLVQSANFA